MKTPNYSAAQVALITAAAVGGVLNLEIATRLASDPAMNDENGTPRTPRAIVAKIARMVSASNGELSYARKEPTTKDGKPVTKKTDLVAEIAAACNVSVAKLDGMEKAPKLALETIRDAVNG